MGERVSAAPPFSKFMPEPEKNQLAYNRCSQPENKKTEKTLQMKQGLVD
jgi:hypothetical protein